jgi:hypothetical protein
MTKWIASGLAAAMLSLTGFVVTGCEDSNDGGGGGNAFVGTWLVSKEATTSYYVFNADYSFVKYRADEPIGGAVHFVGTYTVTDGALSGDFTNRGTGTGKIECTIAADGRLVMDFIEYWHSPPKRVACTGVRQ